MRRSSGSDSHLRRRAELGFTVGEVLMVVSLLTFAGTGVNSLLHRSHKSDKQREEEIAYQQLLQQGRGAVDRIVQEIDQAGTPQAETSAYGTEVNAANSNRVAERRFLVATPAQLIFEADLDHDGSVERVEYRLNGSALERSAVSKYSDGTVPAARYEAIATNVENGEMPLFSYTGDPFGLASIDNSDAVRILLLLRAPVSKKQKLGTIGFEGVAHRPNAVAARQDQLQQQGALQNGEADAVSNLALNELPTQEMHARKWTMR